MRKPKPIQERTYKVLTLSDGQEIVTALPKGIEVEVRVRNTAITQEAKAAEVTESVFTEKLEELQTKPSDFDIIKDSKQEQNEWQNT